MYKFLKPQFFLYSKYKYILVYSKKKNLCNKLD